MFKWIISNQIYFSILLPGSQPSFHGLLGTPFQNPFSLRKQEILNSFSSLVSSLKSCSLFTTAAHKRHFSPLFCLPTTYSYTHISNCSKDPEICILHIKLQTRANKEPKQNRLAYKRKNHTLLYLLPLKHCYVQMPQMLFSFNLKHNWTLLLYMSTTNPDWTHTSQSLFDPPRI